MTIAVDYYDTITTNPELYAKLIKYGDCYIISAVKLENVERLEREVGEELRPYLRAVIYEDYDQVPKQKLDVAKRLGVDLMIDDRLDTCRLFMDNGILAVQPAKYRKLIKKMLPKTLKEQREYNLRRLKPDA